MKFKLLVSIVAVLVLTMFGAAWAEQEVATPEGEPSVNCHTTLTSGAGPLFFSWCVSDHGNLMKFESPAGFEHIRIATLLEGYAVCSQATTTAPVIVHGYDAGFGETAGWVPISITQPGGPNTLPLTIVRNTPDGKFQLTMTFAQSTGGKSVTLTMKVLNISGAKQNNVQLSRIFDGDLDNGPGDPVFHKTVDSVIATDIHGMIQVAETFNIAHVTAVQVMPGAWTDCTSASVATPTAAGDYVGKIVYNLGTINAGASKTVKFTYKRI